MPWFYPERKEKGLAAKGGKPLVFLRANTQLSKIIRSRMYLMVYFKPFSPFSPIQVGEWGSMDKYPS